MNKLVIIGMPILEGKEKKKGRIFDTMLNFVGGEIIFSTQLEYKLYQLLKLYRYSLLY